jgi:hypothetical protein
MSKITCDFPDNILPIGTKVFIPRAAIGDVHEDEVRGYYCTLFKEGDTHILNPTDYRLSILNLGRGSLDDGWKRDEFFLNYEEAKAHAVEYTVSATPEEWFKAIGLNGAEDEERTQFDDECELQSCCATISNIRDILYDVCLTSKITGVTRNSLIKLLETHEPMTNSYPNLTKILSQMNIVWTDNGTDKTDQHT